MKKSDEDDVLNKGREKKLNLKMQFCFLSACFMLLQLSANSVMSQKKMEFEYDDVPLKRILNEIKSQTGYRFFYNVNEIDDKQRTSLNADKETINEVLKKLATKANFDFKINGNQIVLTQNRITIPRSQDTKINGTVTDGKGAPLPGASIVAKGTTNGVTTDFDGNFSIGLADKNVVLVVSYVGFATKEVAVNGQTFISVQLMESASGLDEVVVVGYGVQKKSDITGAVSNVSEEKLQSRPTANFSDALQGRSSGVQIRQSGGDLDGKFEIGRAHV